MRCNKINKKLPFWAVFNDSVVFLMYISSNNSQLNIEVFHALWRKTVENEPLCKAGFYDATGAYRANLHGVLPAKKETVRHFLPRLRLGLSPSKKKQSADDYAFGLNLIAVKRDGTAQAEVALILVAMNAAQKLARWLLQFS